MEKRSSTLLILVLAILIPSFAIAERGIALKNEKRIALIIGNGDYKTGPLRNPSNDAFDMAVTLSNLKFEVTYKANSDLRDMEKAVREFGKKLRKSDVGLFFFAGHGVQVKGRNYLIPVGAEIQEETDVKYEAIDAGRVLDAMYNAGNKINIVILDACRDNPFARSFRSSDRGLAQIDAPKGTLIAYSTSPGSVAQDGTGRNSPYTGSLLKYMKTGDLTIEQVFKKTRREIDDVTGGKQTPWESTSLTGDFYFTSEVVAEVEQTPIQTERPIEDEGLRKEREKLERERLALERLKMEIERKKLEAQMEIEKKKLKAQIEFEKKKLEAERARLESEKKKREMASVPKKPKHSPPSSYGRELGRDNSYIAYANGIVVDTRSGLEWFAGPDIDVNWDDAQAWLRRMQFDGGRWRIPTLDELRTLYRKGAGTRNRTPLIKSKGWYIYSNKDTGAVVYCIDFSTGKKEWLYTLVSGSEDWGDRADPARMVTRVFAVRTRR